MKEHWVLARSLGRKEFPIKGKITSRLYSLSRPGSHQQEIKLGYNSKSTKIMAGLLHAPLLMLTTLLVALNLSLSPMLVHTLQNDTEKFSVQEIGAPEALEYAVSKYNENSDDVYQDVVVEVKDTKFQVCDLEGKEPEFVT